MSEIHKKEAVTGGANACPRKKAARAVAGALAVALVIAGAFFFFGAGEARIPSVEASGDFVRIPVADVGNGRAHFFSYESGGKQVKFFVIKSSDGAIRAAFDACDACYPEKKGYEQNGDFMICRNCGQSFPSAKINEVKGGCNPSPIEMAVVDGNVVITADVLKKGAVYF